ncbi:type II-A CRISPR-associated protein Csn2 [Limosilactobacillus allomucosae]|uniref:type II-A CRISPR-associated protein Csn2 n=1 Tax=Limosilactobacillus allomucosae TaxID=3142938 RepID=UPI0032638025
MNLIYAAHQPMELENSRVTVLMTNNQNVYFEMSQALAGKNDLLRLIDDDFSELNLSTDLCWDADLSSAPDLMDKYSSALLKKISNELTADQRQQLLAKQQELLTAIQDTLFSVDLPLEVSLDDGFQRLYKYARPHLISSANATPYDIIKNDLNIHLELNDCCVLAMKNIANFLLPEQFKAFLQLVEESGLAVFLLEFSEKQQRAYYQNADVYWIDEDFVDWHL